MASTPSTKRLLPVINDNSDKKSGGGCGCTSSGVEYESKFRQLRDELDEVVRVSHERITAGQAPHGVAHAAPPAAAPSVEPDGLVFSRDAALPLVSEITHHHTNGRHLWVGVQRASIAVFDDAQHQVMSMLAVGRSPRDVTSALAASTGTSDAAAWATVANVIGRLATNGFLEPIVGYTEVKAAYPQKFARFHLTKACQLECIHCYADSSPHVDRSDEMTTERWAQLARDFKANGGERVLFTGGEALIHKGCIPLMRLCKELGLYVTLFSNGIMVPKHIDDIQAYCDQVQISLDGPDVPTNDLIRGHGSYAKAVRAVQLLADRGVSVRIGMTAMLENWEAWKAQFVSFAASFRGSSVEFKLSFGITPFGRATDMGSVPIGEVRPVAQRFMEQVNGAMGPKITRLTPGCGYGDQLVVGPGGTVYPCHLLDAPLCHIDDKPVSDIIALLRQVSGQFDVDHVEGCNTCDIRYLCGGMCRVVQSGITGSRLVTMCDEEEKNRKLRNLVDTYGDQTPALSR